jgi:chromosome segregation ATPase
VPVFQIEGFKLHVSHVVKPFTNRVRYTPDVANRPERLEKDLANAKVLVAQLEEEAAKYRSMKISELKVNPQVNGETKPEEDATMAPPEEFEVEQDPEPREHGSVAVERRIGKIMADLREQGLVDVNNEREYEEKKVCFSVSLRLPY